MHRVGPDMLAQLLGGGGDCQDAEALFGMFDQDLRHSLPKTQQEQTQFLAELAQFVQDMSHSGDTSSDATSAAVVANFENGSRGVNKRGAHFDDGSTQAKRRYNDGSHDIIDGQLSCRLCNHMFRSLDELDLHMQSDMHMSSLVRMRLQNQAVDQAFQRQRAHDHIKDLENEDRAGSCSVCVRELMMSYDQHCMTKEHQHKARLVKKGCILCKTGRFPNYEIYKAHIDLDSHKKAKEELNRIRSNGNESKASKDEQKDAKKPSAQPDKVKVKPDPVVIQKKQVEKPETNASPEPELAADGDGTEVGDAVAVAITLQLHTDLAYDPDVAVGQSHVVAVKGFFCKLCHKFYQSEDLAKNAHCKSERHFEKYQEFVISNEQDNDVIDNGVAASPDKKTSAPSTPTIKKETAH